MTEHPADLLSALLDGELNADEQAGVSSHVADCGECQTELERVSEARQLLRRLPQLEPPVPLLRRRHGAPAWVKAVASLAAGFLVVGLAIGPGQREAALDLDTMAGQHTTRAGVDPSISPLIAPGVGGR